MLALFIVFFVAALAFSMLFFIFFSDEAKRRNNISPESDSREANFQEMMDRFKNIATSAP